MFLLLSQSNPYFEETNNNQNKQMAHKDLEGIEIDLKDRYKEQEKIIKFHHSEDNSFEAKEELITSEDEEESGGDSSQNNSSSLISLNSENKINKKLKEKRSITLKKEDQMKLYKNTKFSRFKFLSKIFDLAGIIIIIFTHILSQIEDDEFYSYNKETRISGSILLNYLYTNDSENITWNDVFDDERVNLRKIFFLCLENENETLHKKYPKQIKIILVFIRIINTYLHTANDKDLILLKELLFCLSNLATGPTEGQTFISKTDLPNLVIQIMKIRRDNKIYFEGIHFFKNILTDCNKETFTKISELHPFKLYAEGLQNTFNEENIIYIFSRISCSKLLFKICTIN